MRRIDAHHHLWHYTEEEYGWIGPGMEALRRDFLLNTLEEELRSAAVDGTVVVQARQTVEETAWLLRLARTSPLLWGVVGWLPIAEHGFERLLETYAADTMLKGLRHVVQTEPAGFLEGAAFNAGVNTLRGTGLVYDLLISAGQLAEVTAFVDHHPEQPFVLDHMAKPRIRKGDITPWAQEITALASRPHVCCKISGMVTEADPARWTAGELRPYFDVVLKVFGPDRLMIGTDWPVVTLGCTYAGWWRTVERWTDALSEAERSAILGANAARVYRLSSSSSGKRTAQPESQMA